MGRKVIVEVTKTTTTNTSTSKYGSGNNDNMGRHVIVDTSKSTTTGKYGKGNTDNMGRKVIVEVTKSTATNAGKYGSGSGNAGRQIIIEATTVTKKGETTETTTTRKGGFGKGGKSGYSIENVALNKSGNEKEWKTTGSKETSVVYKGTGKTATGKGGKRAWDLEVSNGDEVYTGRHPSDEEVSTGGNGYTKYSSQVKYVPTKGGVAKVSKYQVQKTSNTVTKGY
jgi:hypothetical protein